MDNETSVTPAWGEYWATYIKEKAKEANTNVETTEMWDAWDIFHPQHEATVNHPEVYSFCDISQNNHQKGQTHWDNAQKFRAQLSPVRPINNIKIYGSDQGRFGNTQDGLERFWRNIFGGLASSRFHRPTSGQGLNENAQAHIKSMRMLIDNMDIFTCEPHNDLLYNREENEAYAIANPGKEYAVYFPNGGSVDLQISNQGKIKMKWLNIAETEWTKEETIGTEDKITLSAPGKGHWAVLVKH